MATKNTRFLWVLLLLCFCRPLEGEATPPPLDKVIQQVEQQTGGRVISASPNHRGNFHTLRLLMPSGEIKQFRFDNSKGTIQPLPKDKPKA